MLSISRLLMVMVGVCVLMAMNVTPIAAREDAFDIAPFALPNCDSGEIRFEEPRDIIRVVVTFAEKPAGDISVSYLHKYWPGSAIEFQLKTTDNSMGMGWAAIDDWFMSKWKKSEANLSWRGNTATFTFKPLTTEFPDCKAYDVSFRRTLGLQVDTKDKSKISKFEVYTVSKPIETKLRVELDAGTATAGNRINLTSYNSIIQKVKPISGAKVAGNEVNLQPGGKRLFEINVRHMSPAREYAYDGGMVTFGTKNDVFTIGLDDLAKDGPIWYADEGVYVAKADDPTTFEAYKARNAGKATINSQVAAREQSLGGALMGQPRPKAESFIVGCKHARQRFRIEENGDVVLARMPMDWVKGKDSPRFKSEGDSRFFFGLDRWVNAGRFVDSLSVPAYNTKFMRDGVTVEQKSFAVPLLKPASDGDLIGDDTIVGMVHFRFKNDGLTAAVAELPIDYSTKSCRMYNRYIVGGYTGAQSDDYLVPRSEREKLAVSASDTDPAAKVISTVWQDQKVVRCTLNTPMQIVEGEKGIVLRKELQPGESCDVVLKIPYIAIDTPDEMKSLARLDFGTSYSQVRDFWVKELAKGALVKTPEPRLNAWYKAHVSHVQIADFSMPDEPELVNTSVGTSTYPNYSNESCMIVQELDERGLHEEARRRLAVWLKYQGTAPLMGMFSDYDGVFYGAGGYQCGDSYDQHHGWVLWCLAEHYFVTRDDAWLSSAANNIIKGCDWVFRQRKLTMTKLPHSRGWEYGFLAAGSLEDVSDYFYWLSTNAVTWRGVDSAARALEAINHPDASRIRKEADAYKADLIKGFDTMRQQTPLARLKDGRWIPNYPSRLYLRGRDVGWIREVLEGSVYLLIAGLYDPNSKQGAWILDDYQENRYINPVYGYRIHKVDECWFDFGGFSNQPNLLAGLLPHLDRDEPEIYDWMFFNAFAACYREEVNSMTEHPMPYLGYSNSAIVKTSDQANSVKWLRYMYVYAPKDTLYLGRAIPRAWFANGREISAERVSTRFGEVSVKYQSEADQGNITLTANLELKNQPAKIIARLRHPKSLLVKSVTVNGQDFAKFDPVKGDVDLTGLIGSVVVEAKY